MKAGLRFGAVLILAAGLAAGLTRVPEALAHVEAFRVRTIDVEGHRFLTYQDALRAASVPPEASVWDDLETVEERLRGHPLVLEARVRRRLPATLVLEVRERDPVALLPTPSLVPVDATGRMLPVDPAAHRLDLPLVDPFPVPARKAGRLTPGELRTVAETIGRLARTEPQLTPRISEVRWLAGDLEARLTGPEVVLLFPPSASSGRLREGLVALSDARERWPDRTPRAVDLRFVDQVVVRYGGGSP